MRANPLQKLHHILGYHWVILACALFFTLFYHATFWRTLFVTTSHFPHPFLLWISIGVSLWIFLALSFELLSTQRLYRFTLLPLIFLGAFSAYYMDNFNISINPMIIESLLKTTPKEAADFVSFKVIFRMFSLALVPCILVLFVKPPKTRAITKLILILSYALLLLGIWLVCGKSITFAFKSYKPTLDMLNPIAPIRSTIRYLSDIASTPTTYTQVGPDAVLLSHDKPKIFVLVIGESARAQNLEFNGYKRPTNPYTKDLPNLINFSNFYSCGTITAISIPCMLTNLTHKTYTSRNLSLYRDNLLDIAQRAGYSVWWISNNGGACMGQVCRNIPHVSYYNGKHLDGDMLQEIATLIKHAKQNTFIVVNLHGSHGARYFERYPQNEEYFTPVCKNENLQECSKESLINAYDNSLRYSDFVLRSIINSLQDSPLATALWYVSDHGESLGEKGQYMHGGLPYVFAPQEQKHIASFIWLGKDFSTRYLTPLQARKDSLLNHDYVFHTILSLLNVRTKDCESALDLTRPMP